MINLPLKFSAQSAPATEFALTLAACAKIIGLIQIAVFMIEPLVWVNFRIIFQSKIVNAEVKRLEATIVKLSSATMTVVAVGLAKLVDFVLVKVLLMGLIAVF